MIRLRAAVVQTASILYDTPRTLAKLADLTAQAASNGARLAVFPEAFVGGYPKGADFGARVGSRSPEGRQAFQHYFDGAIKVPGPETETMGRIASAHGIVLVTGAIERLGGTLYCSVLTFDADGHLAGLRRKLMPTAMERLVWGFGDGSTLGVAQTRIGTVGGVICWENYMPMLRMAMYAQGVQFYCAPTVDDRDSWAPTMRTIALEGRCFVLSACQYMTRADAPDDFDPIQGNAPETVLIRGGSVIVNPLGSILAGPVFDEEAILYAELDTDEIAQGKYDFDVTGHYARPDIFRLEIDTRAQAPVHFGATAKEDG